MTFTVCQPTTTDKGQDDQTIPYHQDDQFAHDAFGFPVTVDNLKGHFGQLKTKATPMQNRYDESIVDTIYQLSTGKTELVIYRAQGHDLFQSAYIDTDEIGLKNNIRTGMTKTDFADKFGLDISTDKIEIGNLENTSVWTFTFTGDKLSSIKYSGYVD